MIIMVVAVCLALSGRAMVVGGEQPSRQLQADGTTCPTGRRSAAFSRSSTATRFAAGNTTRTWKIAGRWSTAASRWFATSRHPGVPGTTTFGRSGPFAISSSSSTVV